MKLIQEQMLRAKTKRTRDLILALHAQAELVQEYSNDDRHPNVSAYLRSGAIEQILLIEEELTDG